jgi:hypothetical protein
LRARHDQHVNGSRGHDYMFGGNGRDIINANIGNDVVDGGNGNDSIVGSDGNDILLGGPGSDLIRGDRGNDVLLGGDASDMIEGGPGRDVIIGGLGGDQLFGSNDDDIMIAGDLDLGNGPYIDPDTGVIDMFVFDADIAVLQSINADWMKPASLASRMMRLEDRLNSTTIIDDFIRDSLYGQNDSDWFLTVTEDVVRDLRANDVRQNLDA